jgi:hypothetical protein
MDFIFYFLREVSKCKELAFIGQGGGEYFSGLDGSQGNF